MAEAPRDQCAPLPTGGYECQFVDSLPESLTCLVCLLPFRDPHLLDCCGVKLCATCVGRIDAAGQPCPHCREQRFVHILDKNTRRQVLGRKVRCSRKKDGCEWEGELRHLEEHERGVCGWALVLCRYQCGGCIPRRQLEEHEIDDCPQRPVDVKMMSFMRKMEEKLTSEKERHEKEMAAVREEFKKTLQEERESHKQELDTSRKTHAAQVQQLEQMVTRKLDEQKKEHEAKMEQLEQSLQKLRADMEEQVVKPRKEVGEDVIPQCAVVKEMRGCQICLKDHAVNPVRTNCCQSVFCKVCLDKYLVHSLLCPVCKIPLHMNVGNQPDGGTMTHHTSSMSLPGYEGCGTITIIYNIPSGIQGPKHPHPGKRFSGTSRSAYLPDNREGREVLSLLKKAFDQRLVFTVGTSVTSGASDTVVWNGIRHKTNTHGGPSHYGYPDPNYLTYVKDVLKAKGIF